MRTLLLVLLSIPLCAQADPDHFVDAIISGAAKGATCSVKVEDNQFDFTFDGPCYGNAYSSDQVLVVLQTSTGTISEEDMQYFFVFPTEADLDEGARAYWNGEPSWRNASNSLGQGIYQNNCYVSDTARVCVEPQKPGLTSTNHIPTNCEVGATNVAEVRQCLGNKANQAMNAALEKLERKLANELNDKALASLKASQITFEMYRSNTCDFITDLYVNEGWEASDKATNCYTNLTKARTTFISELD